MDHDAELGIYDAELALRYDKDPFQLVASSNDLAFSVVEEHVPSPKVALEIGCGTGDNLLRLRHLYPNTKLVGLDSSAPMLAVARQKLQFHSIQADALAVRRYFTPASLNLVLIHFVLAYVPAGELLPSVAGLMQSDGYCSVVTTTLENFPRLRQVSTFLDLAQIQDLLNNPPNIASLVSLARASNLIPLEQRVYRKNIRFSNADELFSFACHAGWLTQVVGDYPQEVQVALQGMPFPFDEEFSAEILLCKKGAC